MVKKLLFIAEQNASFNEVIPLRGTEVYDLDLSTASVEAGFQKFYNEGRFHWLNSAIVGKTVTIHLDPDDTKYLEFGKYVYQVKVKVVNDVYCIAEGTLFLNPGIRAQSGSSATSTCSSCGEPETTCQCELPDEIDAGLF